MLSARGNAWLGLGAAGVLFVLSIAVLAAGASQRPTAQPGSLAPEFSLSDALDGKTIHLSDHRGSVVVLCFTSIRCPVCNNYNARLASFANEFGPADGVKILGIQCNLGAGPAAEQDRREVPVQSRAAGLEFPQLLDEGNMVARQYGIRLTPTFIVIDAHGVIRYRGSFDDNSSPARVQSKYLNTAVRTLLAGKLVEYPRTQGDGCAIAAMK